MSNKFFASWAWLCFIIGGIFGFYFSINEAENYLIYDSNDNIIAETTVPEADAADSLVQAQKEKTEKRKQTEEAANQSAAADFVLIADVPFSPQAPLGEWSNPIEQDGCEEMAAIMAMRWVEKRALTKTEAKKELLALADWQAKKYKNYTDTSAYDTVERIFKDYYNYDKVKVAYDIGVNDIVDEIMSGNIVIVPLDGRAINNPYYTRGGPERHMLLIKGYDPAAKEFITNDSGTRRGENYRYSEDAVIKSIRDYPTGKHAPITEIRRAMIVVGPK